MEILGELNIAILLSQTGIGCETVEEGVSVTVSVVQSTLWQSLSPRKSLVEMLVNTLGDASAKAQGLPAPVTSLLKLQTSGDVANGGCAHRMYIASSGNKAFGFIKVGRKQLFLSVPSFVREGKSRSARRCEMISNGTIPGGTTNDNDISSSQTSTRLSGRGSSSTGIVNQEIAPLCVLDFFVHSSVRRSGIGRILFDQMAIEEAILLQSGRGGGGKSTNVVPSLLSSSHYIINPARLGYDRPSALFTSFLRKHFGLETATPQPYSMVVFNDYFAESDLIDAPQRDSSHLGDGASTRNEANTTSRATGKEDVSVEYKNSELRPVASSSSMSSSSVLSPSQPLSSSMSHSSAGLSVSNHHNNLQHQALPFSPFRPLIVQQSAPTMVASPSLIHPSPQHSSAQAYTSPNNAYSGRRDAPSSSSSNSAQKQPNEMQKPSTVDDEKSTVDFLRGMTLNPSRYHGQTHLASSSSSSSISLPSTSSSSEYVFSPSSLSMPISSSTSQPALLSTASDMPHAFGQGRSPLRNSNNTRIGTDNSSRGVTSIFTQYTTDTQEIEEQGSLAAAVKRNARLFGRSPQH